MPAAREASEGDMGLFTLLHLMVLPHIPSLSAFLPFYPITQALLCAQNGHRAGAETARFCCTFTKRIPGFLQEQIRAGPSAPTS